jgi:hypothetical protein
VRAISDRCRRDVSVSGAGFGSRAAPCAKVGVWFVSKTKALCVPKHMNLHCFVINKPYLELIINRNYCVGFVSPFAKVGVWFASNKAKSLIWQHEQD